MGKNKPKPQRYTLEAAVEKSLRQRAFSKEKIELRRQDNRLMHWSIIHKGQKISGVVRARPANRAIDVWYQEKTKIDGTVVPLNWRDRFWQPKKGPKPQAA